ncbi:hypothetical protein NDU88_005491 [Pleurodeles waltl]|uniref:Uncharacterized protein n=1 Tax=Pleurodeles waltl TaxID=8319 RepID=A0AAV7LLL8_PLEWA|nr:hypothetical protein NDU88_005491 [Pleurodeles waltl]
MGKDISSGECWVDKKERRGGMGMDASKSKGRRESKGEDVGPEDGEDQRQEQNRKGMRWRDAEFAKERGRPVMQEDG